MQKLKAFSVCCCVLVAIANSSFAQVITTTFLNHSVSVGDTFAIYISHIGPIDPSVHYSTAYYSDGDIESGMELRNALANDSSNKSAHHTIFIGIGQRGHYHNRRRRDLVPPVLDNATVVQENNPMYRHADKYYKYIAKELIPMIEIRYPTNGKRTLIGHSFGGLFTFWCMLKNDGLFHNYIALSPSFWKNSLNIFDYEEAFYQRRKPLHAYLYLSTGGRETLNFVRYGTRRMKHLLDERQYAGLRYDYFEHKGKVHSTQVPVSFKWIMQNVDF